MPRIAFDKIAKEILGNGYELSLVLIGDTLMHRLNSEYRNKNYPTNVLSFPIDTKEGEIFINVRKAEREAKALSIPKKERIAYLFTHGCLHLKGLEHGKKMDVLEEQFMKKIQRYL